MQFEMKLTGMKLRCAGSKHGVIFYSCFVLGLLFLARVVAAGDPDDPTVWSYASSCFSKLGVKNAPELKGPFNCEAGTRLPLKIDGKVADIGHCSGDDCVSNFPKTCDTPAWLPAAENCYGNSFMQLIQPQSNKDVKAVLLCRHNETWTSNPRKFNDIAMIVHNKKNGETCWFQSRLGRKLNGKRVKGPSTVRSHLFWKRPVEAMHDKCIGCHDSGPFVVSPWIRGAFTATNYFDQARGPYKSSTKPFDRWPKPHFISIGKFGLKAGDKSCTSCHKIAAGGRSRIKGSAASITWETCRTWIDRATDGRGTNPFINQHYKNEPVYMPLSSFSAKTGYLGFGNSWTSRYRKHVKQLKSCCEQLGSDPGDVDENCQLYER